MSRHVWKPGDRCGAHEILRRLAEGGHGQVYLARHDSGELRAIKTLHEQFIDVPDVRRRFDDEIVILAVIDNLHVVCVFEHGRANGHPWFSMEYLNGQSLRKVMADAGGRLDVERAFRFARQIARGAHAAHQYGTIHRDLKPDNIIIMPGDTVKILDFGIAKIRGWAVPTTGRGEGFCTPLYAAPEQVDGSGRRADARTDVYTIGVMLWEMVIGRNPFLDEDGNQLAMDITLSVKLTRELRRIPDMLTGFPDYLSAVIEKATALDPKDRYASAHELAAGIKAPLQRWVRESRPEAPEPPKDALALAGAVRTDSPARAPSIPLAPELARSRVASTESPATSSPETQGAPSQSESELSASTPPQAAPSPGVQSAPEPDAPAASPPTGGWAQTLPLAGSFTPSWPPAKKSDDTSRAKPAQPGTDEATDPKLTAPARHDTAGGETPPGAAYTAPRRMRERTAPESTGTTSPRAKAPRSTGIVAIAAIVGAAAGAALVAALVLPGLRPREAEPSGADSANDAGVQVIPTPVRGSPPVSPERPPADVDPAPDSPDAGTATVLADAGSSADAGAAKKAAIPPQSPPAEAKPVQPAPKKKPAQKRPEMVF